MEYLIRHASLHDEVDEVIREHVREGHYDLVGPNGGIILPSAWDSTIQPGWRITMKMWPTPTNVIHNIPEEEEPGISHNDQDRASQSKTAQPAFERLFQSMTKKTHSLTDVPAKTKR